MGKSGGQKKKIEDGETYGFCPQEENPHNVNYPSLKPSPEGSGF